MHKKRNLGADGKKCASRNDDTTRTSRTSSARHDDRAGVAVQNVDAVQNVEG